MTANMKYRNDFKLSFIRVPMKAISKTLNISQKRSIALKIQKKSPSLRSRCLSQTEKTQLHGPPIERAPSPNRRRQKVMYSQVWPKNIRDKKDSILRVKKIVTIYFYFKHETWLIIPNIVAPMGRQRTKTAVMEILYSPNPNFSKQQGIHSKVVQCREVNVAESIDHKIFYLFLKAVMMGLKDYFPVVFSGTSFPGMSSSETHMKIEHKRKTAMQIRKLYCQLILRQSMEEDTIAKPTRSPTPVEDIQIPRATLSDLLLTSKYWLAKKIGITIEALPKPIIKNPSRRRIYVYQGTIEARGTKHKVIAIEIEKSMQVRFG